MQTILKTISLFLILSVPLASSSYAAVVVYTDRAAWEAALLEVPHFHDQNFNNELTQPLNPGDNFFIPMIVNIPGTPGYNAIDDSFTADPFSDALSPNGSTYYLGDVGVSASVAPVLSFVDLEYSVIAFGADWVVQGDLTLEMQGMFIPFDIHLPTGSGFLGVITDQPAGEFLTVNLLGTAVFGMDNVRINSVPIPAAVWLFASGLLGLIGIARKKAA